MKRFLSLLVAMLVLCACLPACAAPRYPERQGGTTDAAAVLSQSTLRDLATYAQRLKDKPISSFSWSRWTFWTAKL